eukprot:IDg13865t1
MRCNTRTTIYATGSLEQMSAAIRDDVLKEAFTWLAVTQRGAFALTFDRLVRGTWMTYRDWRSQPSAAFRCSRWARGSAKSRCPIERALTEHTPRPHIQHIPRECMLGAFRSVRTAEACDSGAVRVHIEAHEHDAHSCNAKDEYMASDISQACSFPISLYAAMMSVQVDMPNKTQVCHRPHQPVLRRRRRSVIISNKHVMIAGAKRRASLEIQGLDSGTPLLARCARTRVNLASLADYVCLRSVAPLDTTHMSLASKLAECCDGDERDYISAALGYKSATTVMVA